jgi:hypothetical protein
MKNTDRWLMMGFANRGLSRMESCDVSMTSRARPPSGPHRKSATLSGIPVTPVTEVTAKLRR